MQDLLISSSTRTGRRACITRGNIIELYRALLLYATGDDEASCSCFSRALDLAQGGATLQLIRATIGTIAHYCFDHNFLKSGIHESLERVAGELAGIPAAERAVEMLRSIVDSPTIAAYNIEDALAVLPFNYH